MFFLGCFSDGYWAKYFKIEVGFKIEIDLEVGF